MGTCGGRSRLITDNMISSGESITEHGKRRFEIGVLGIEGISVVINKDLCSASLCCAYCIPTPRLEVRSVQPILAVLREVHFLDGEFARMSMLLLQQDSDTTDFRICRQGRKNLSNCTCVDSILSPFYTPNSMYVHKTNEILCGNRSASAH